MALPRPAWPPPAPNPPWKDRDNRIFAWIFRLIGAAALTWQFFIERPVQPMVVSAAILIGATPEAYQLWKEARK